MRRENAVLDRSFHKVSYSVVAIPGTA